MKVRLYTIAILTLTTFMLLACSSDHKDKQVNLEDKTEKTNENQQTELGDYHVSLKGEIKETADHFIVEGKSNLLPESRIVGELVVDDGDTIFSDTSELVQQDGSFKLELEHHQYGEAEIVIRFDFENAQNEEIQRHYGDKGQKLEGPFIYKHDSFDGIMKKAEASVSYTPNEENTLLIQEPEWYEKPEDYGDPRVWIEVKDITDDGEYFYVHGISNLLEGSEITINYKGNRDQTLVKPDGSFDFTFDYEYLEDEELVISFEPSFIQWNEIQEAYGENGQKLIGNLVVSDEYNREKQYIEKRIPMDDYHLKHDSNEEDEEDEDNSSEQTDE